ncbi:MAG: uroporphyrinogen decarboxylase/cobalamine-independent methonine synthase family protein [Armatimonadota bacterium]
MIYALPEEERRYLRQLARRQAEIAALPEMEMRRRMWRELNDGVPGARPPFVIETFTWDRDFMPASILRCRTDYGRGLERTFLRFIREYELLGDDHVCPDTLDMGWHFWFDPFGIDIKVDRVEDSEGIHLGYHFNHPITDLCDGFAMIKPETFGVDKEETLAEKVFLEETFGDILPVAIRSSVYANNCLTQQLMWLMSMETFFTAMYDCPDTLHALLAQLTDNGVRLARWAEAEGLLALNNGHQRCCGSHYNYTTQLPKGDGAVRLGDMWGEMDSQETVGVSPELFHEFCFPYYRTLAEMYGFVYWGCCEPADPIWDTSLSQLPNLKAVSISRWADQHFMAEVLDGTGIVYSRKPNPNLLGVDRVLDEEAWAAEIRETLEITAGKNIPLEFLVRDVYTMHGNLEKPRRAVEIARREIDRFFPQSDKP